MKLRNKFLVLTTLLLLCMGCSKTQKIPSEDYKTLEAFFESLTKDFNIAYTLFGSKPVSFACYCTNDPTSFEAFILDRGWKCWSRYKDNFPSQNFFIRKLDFEGRNKCESGFRGIYVINKQETLKVLKTHTKLFQELLNTQLNAEDILTNLLNSDEFFNKSLAKSDVLGILLGYGVNNALNFEKQFNLPLNINKMTPPPFKEISNELNAKSRIIVNGYAKTNREPHSDFSSFEVSTLILELNKITELMKFFGLEDSNFLLEKIQSPVFSADLEDEETKKLYQSYSDTRNKIQEIYQGKSIFEVTIEQWMKN